jgi:sugar lactone lactonase YvrE
VLDPSQSSVWVSVNDGTLHQFDLRTGNELKRFDYSLNAMAFGEDGKLYGTDWLNRSVQRIDTTTGLSETFVAPSAGGLWGPSGLTFHDDYLYVTSRISGEVLRFDADTGEFHDSFARSAANGPQHTTFGPDGNFYVANVPCGCVQRFDGNSGSFLDVFVTPSAGLSDGATPAFGPDGNFYLSTWATGIIKFDAAGRYLDTFEMPLGVTGFTFAPSSLAAPVPEAATACLWLAALGILPIGVARRRRPRA